ncbi:MAG: DUF2846 domain-containing protein [Desulfovibrionaceae bacterium]|nr:DUF2846 domain-containing protein [Desulfovibrionaceae bacterium]
MKTFSPLCVLLLTVFLAGCAAMPLRGDYVKEQTAPVIVPDAQSAVIYFVRESAFTGGGISYFVCEDTVRIGLLKSGTYFIYKTTPGKHTYHAETEARAAVTLDVEAGKTYYVEGGISIGMWAGQPRLAEVTEPVARQLIPDLDYVRLATDEEREAYRAKEEQGKSSSGIKMN